MSKIPSAWDDDWETAANAAPAASPPKVLSRTERKAAHVEANKKLWDAAEAPQRSYFLESRNDVPLKNEFKPQLKVLSRKPSPQVASRPQSGSATGQPDEDDSEEEERRRAAETFAERQQRAAREREEKQRKYAEARERIMGSSTPVSSGSNSRQQSHRGGHAARSGSRQGSSAEQSPARSQTQPTKTLFDPGYSTRPTDGRPSPRSGTPNLEQPVRMPRGPDGSGRGGFAPRGGRGG
ncbi:hypothetical protein K461DRAFT_291537 [Myriangium duriaei CBS 260.36]|uniref:SUZ domain-containing protein n=1 Tax=Myriangium duriaei CBS 260.36 TaxID=1168546 RepID=A0A9P4J4T2_9PEZI|nr:hypothetical protein K461DRAFT_291537 [Myriangium duriaei CBS 260.36]